MPLFRTIHDDDITIALWQITENEYELLQYVGRVEGLPSNSNRRLERLATFALMKTLGFSHEYLYTESGRPYLPNTAHKISISHTAGMVAFAYSKNQEIGVDIELTSRNVKKVAAKYLSVIEMRQSAGFSDSLYPLIWCAKETLYKLPWRKSLTFNRDIEICIDSISFDSGTLLAKVFNHENRAFVKLFFTFIDNYCLTWTGMNRLL